LVDGYITRLRCCEGFYINPPHWLTIIKVATTALAKRSLKEGLSVVNLKTKELKQINNGVRDLSRHYYIITVDPPVRFNSVRLVEPNTAEPGSGTYDTAEQHRL
jgi:hypothetical protein